MSQSFDDEIERVDRLIQADDPSALEEAQRLTEQYPTELKAWMDLAHVYARLDQYDQAVDALTQALDVGPTQPALYEARGRYELRRNNLEAALANFTAGIASCHEHQRTYYLELLHFYRADVLVRLGRFEEARADLAQVEDGYKFWTTTLITKTELLAACDGKEWNWEQVAVEGSREKRLEAIDMGALENAPKAVELAKRLTDDYPDDAEVWQYLAYAHSVNENHATAIVVMQKVITLEPDEPSWYHFRAYLKAKLDDFTAALEDLDRAAKCCDPEKRLNLWPEIHFWRADMLLRLGRKAEARAALEHVPDGYSLRTLEIRTKKDMLAECAE